MSSVSAVRVLMSLSVALIAGCRSAPPPHSQQDLCAIFDQHPEWYDAATESQETWGTPAHILMSFVKQESAFVSSAKPPRNWFLFIPMGRASSAEGYAQAQDDAWDEYRRENGGFLKSRTNIEDALDFIGWYNHLSSQNLGISKLDPKRLYLAYHEGRTGYARGSYDDKPEVVSIADRVARQARLYGEQLRQCEERFKCRRWYQIGPFCD